MKKILLFSALCFLLIFSCRKDPELPAAKSKVEIGTSSVDSISYFTAEVSTNLTSTGGQKIIQHGHCWSQEEEPDINDARTSLGSLTSPKIFTSNLSSLESNAKYYIRSYVSLENTVIYGNQEQIITLKAGLPLLTTSSVTNITTYSAVCGGTVMSDSGYVVIKKGICWDTVASFTVANCLGKATGGEGLGVFTCVMPDLEDGKYYNVKAYAINQAGTNYGEIKNFRAVPITVPTVTTSPATNPTINSAQCGGNVSSDGNGTVTARGVCWSNSSEPTLENCLGFTSEGPGVGSYTSMIIDLEDGIEYFVRAYAMNEKGIAYGDEISFSTLELSLPTVITGSVTNITSYTAICQGDVLDDGNGTISSRGICYSLNDDPVLENCLGYTIEGAGLGSYVSNIVGLDEGEVYYYRAYANNEKGIAYGTTFNFTTWKCGDLLSYEGKDYNTVLIDTRCWMAQNLDVGVRINLSQHQTNNGIIEKYCYWDQPEKCDIYGGLYLWNEMMNYHYEPGSKGICPTGWHLPTYLEYDDLITHLEGSEIAGGKLKEDGFNHWKEPNTGATNESGYTALPGGVRTPGGSVAALTEQGFFWVSEDNSSGLGCLINLKYNFSSVSHGSVTDKSNGMSVRCLRDYIN